MVDGPPVVGRVYVLDGSGALRRAFDNRELAHAYAHEQTTTALTHGRWPERWEVFDPTERTSRFVGGGGCAEVRWMAVGSSASCSVRPQVVASDAPF